MRRRSLLFLSLLILLLGSLILYQEHSTNFHVGTEGKLYRSAQLRGERLHYYLQRYGIRSILNLREVDHDEWYQEEVMIARQMGVSHYDYPISSNETLTMEQMEEIVGILLRAPKPLLVHCQGGVDRTGLVSALWEYAVEGKTPEEAAEQLSLGYGILALFKGPKDAMRESFWRFVREGRSHRKDEGID